MASRSRKELNRELFARLTRCAENDGQVVLSGDEAPRWIAKLSEDDSELMAKANVTASLKINRHNIAIQICHRESIYYVVQGLRYDDLLPDGLVPEALTPAFFTIAVTQSDIQPTGNGLDILNLIGERYGLNDNGGEFSLDEILSLFPPIFVVRADQNFEYTSIIERVFGSLLSRFYSDGPIEMREDLLLEFKELFENGSPAIPFRNVLQGFLSISWSGLFLELYRCVEQLYSVPRVAALASVWPTTLSYRQLTDILATHLSWRPKEDDSLAKIISECEFFTLQKLALCFCSADVAGDDPSPERVANDIYKIRNQLVHFRPGSSQHEYTDEEWSRRISAMILLVRDLYDRHGTRFG